MQILIILCFFIEIMVTLQTAKRNHFNGGTSNYNECVILQKLKLTQQRRNRLCAIASTGNGTDFGNLSVIMLKHTDIFKGFRSQII